MNELNLIGESGTKSIANVTSAGTASERAYIGEAEAKRIALAHAGVNEGDIYGYEFEMDYEHGAMIYELEFDCAGCEYEYDINAKTGEIIKFEADRRGSVSPSPAPQPASSKITGSRSIRQRFIGGVLPSLFGDLGFTCLFWPYHTAK